MSDDENSTASIASFAAAQRAKTRPITGKQAAPEVASDQLNALRFLDEHGAGVRYAPEIGRWLIWNGSHWVEDRLERVCELANRTIEALRAWTLDATSDDDYKRRTRHYTESCRSGRREGMLIIARCDLSVAVGVDQLDRHRHLLPCANGTVDLRSGELHEAEPDDLMTKGTPLDYYPDARSQEWEDFLGYVFDGNVDTIAFVQRLFGYAATGETAEHLLPILWGTGKNGKSSLVDAVTGVLGDMASVAAEGLLKEQKHEQHPERIAALRGKRLVVSSELENQTQLAEGLVKMITGGDKLSARQMHGHRFEFDPTHTVVLMTNHAPKVRGTDEGIWRRLKMVPFTVTIPVRKRILEYGKQLAERNGEAILAWLIAGAGAWYRDGLGSAEQVEQATLDYRQREDVFASFLEECTIAIQGRTALKVLHTRWQDWSKANGNRVGRTQDFSNWLTAHGVELESYQGTRFALKIGLLSERPDESASVRSDGGISGNFPTRAHASESLEMTHRDPTAGAEEQADTGFQDEREGPVW